MHNNGHTLHVIRSIENANDKKVQFSKLQMHMPKRLSGLVLKTEGMLQGTIGE